MKQQDTAKALAIFKKSKTYLLFGALAPIIGFLFLDYFDPKAGLIYNALTRNVVFLSGMGESICRKTSDKKDLIPEGVLAWGRMMNKSDAELEIYRGTGVQFDCVGKGIRIPYNLVLALSVGALAYGWNLRKKELEEGASKREGK